MKMKKAKLIAFAGIVSMVSFISCSEDQMPDNLSLASKVKGVYSGTVKSSKTNQTSPATMTVEMQNDSVVTLTCTSDNFDTTLVMQLYENYDSVMVCYTGQDFYNEYGHAKNQYDFCNSKQKNWTNDDWMSDDKYWNNDHSGWGNKNWSGSDQWNAWTNHMNTQHNQGDRHMGGFDINSNSCTFNFSIDNNRYFEKFTGTKNR